MTPNKPEATIGGSLCTSSVSSGTWPAGNFIIFRDVYKGTGSVRLYARIRITILQGFPEKLFIRARDRNCSTLFQRHLKLLVMFVFDGSVQTRS